MLYDVLMWWWAVGCILLLVVLIHPRAYDLADLEDEPTLQPLPAWGLVCLFWPIAMLSALIWPFFLVRGVWRGIKKGRNP